MSSMLCDSLQFCLFHRCLQCVFGRSIIETKNYIRHLHNVYQELARVTGETSGKPSSSEARSWKVRSWIRLREEQVRCRAAAAQTLSDHLSSR